jgi:hypothetical protein
MIDMGKWLLLGFETFDRQVSQLFFEEKWVNKYWF